MEFVTFERPAGIDGHAPAFRKLQKRTVACYGEYLKALRAFFKPKGELEELRARIHSVGELESEIDEDERALIRSIFESDLDLAGKQHLARLVAQIVRISDQIENAADVLELLSLKSII